MGIFLIARLNSPEPAIPFDGLLVKWPLSKILRFESIVSRVKFYRDFIIRAFVAMAMAKGRQIFSIKFNTKDLVNEFIKRESANKPPK